VSDLKPDHQRRDLYKSNLPVTSRKIGPVFINMFHLDVSKVDLLLHMLQWLYTYVASECFKYFICFKHMLQLSYVVYVLMVIHVCCKCVFQLF
jgi:hypothetical protein